MLRYAQGLHCEDKVIQFGHGLSPEAQKALDDIVKQRMLKHGETLYEAREFVARWMFAVIGN